MVTNATKHAKATAIQIRADGIGRANQAGSGLSGIRDRVQAVGGTFTIESNQGSGTVGICDLPTAVPTQPLW